MEPKNKNNVHNIGRNDRDAIARQVGMTEFEPSESVHKPEQVRDHRPGRVLTALGATAAVLGTAWLAAPRSHDAPLPDDKKTFSEEVAESAQKPYDPAKDELVIDGIRVKPGNPDRNTPSEAVLGDPRVKAFVEANPDESSSVTTSAMSLPGGNEAGIVMRDVDHDGDKDAVAVQIEEEHPSIEIEDKTIH
mgnify:CR=1 FL=1